MNKAWLWKGALALMVLLLVALLGGYLWVRSYLRSDDFRQELARQLGGAAGGAAELTPIRWRGVAMEVDGVSLESSLAGNWEVGGVRTQVDLSGFWDKIWIVPQIEVREAHAEWDFCAKGDSLVQESSRKESLGATPRKKGSGFLPNRTEVRELTIDDFSGEIETEQGAFAWSGTRLETRPRPQNSSLIHLEGGRLQTPLSWLGPLSLRSGSLSLRKDGLELIKSEWRGDDFARLELRGGVDAEGQALGADFVDWQTGSFLPRDWGKIVEGAVSGHADWTREGEASSLEAALQSQTMTVEGLPFLDRLAAYAGNGRLRRLTFEEAAGKLSLGPEAWAVRELVLFDEGLLRIEGQLESRSRSLSGQLQVGVPPGLLAHIPGAEEKVFLPGKSGLLWASVNLSGTLDAPQEDLSERMIQAAGERMFELIPETGQWALRFSGQALDETTALLLGNQGILLGEGTRAAQEAIEQGGDVVEEGVRTGFGILNGILGGEED